MCAHVLWLSSTPLRDYEKLKREKVRANNEIFGAVGLPQIVSSFNASAALNSKSKGKKGKEKEKDVEESDSQYIPENEGEVESDDLSEVHCSNKFLLLVFGLMHFNTMNLIISTHLTIYRRSNQLRLRKLNLDRGLDQEPM